MIKKAEILAVLFVFLSFWTGSIQAEVMTIYLSAEVTYLDDPESLLEGEVNVGDAITGSYLYDSSTPDTDVLNLDTIGHYQHSSSPFGVSLSMGGFTFQTDPDNVDFVITILNNHNGGDMYGLLSYNNLPLSNGVHVENIAWQLDDYSGTALSSDALPITPPVLTNWQDTWAHLNIAFG
ncbi:MAG: hypothetical protein GWN67_17750 [Phycisphaerae bacterium]|nr:hypothetical protein [Phycisphaerae bacterium]NIP52947.1 hypothetical protein [Phycisphaerae bacterium]NIS51998.1 hypothetical protein [Phycisphaerae bacterium]NIU09512.1 hypothetical protein [Phycisphaerae bacterium]NIU58163.1 hypothetical protein [Phycisphaerae bacterium]